MTDTQKILFSTEIFNQQQVEKIPYSNLLEITEYFFDHTDRKQLCRACGLRHYYSVQRTLKGKVRAPRPHVWAHFTAQLNKAIERKRADLPNAKSDNEPSANILEIMTR